MDNQNRYEEVPQKENVFLKILKMFGTYLKNLFYDFFTSFKYNNMKLAGYLVAVPGVFIGFFMGLHANLVNGITYAIFKVGDADEFLANYKFSFDFSSLSLFMMMLFGILNIFTAAQMMGKKNLGSVVVATITTVGILVSGALYIYAIVSYLQGVALYREGGPAIDAYLAEFARIDKLTQTTGAAEALEKYNVVLGADGVAYEFSSLEKFQNFLRQQYCIEHALEIGIPIQADSDKITNTDLVLSLGSIGISMLCPVIGCILGFIKYDRFYEKVVR